MATRKTATAGKANPTGIDFKKLAAKGKGKESMALVLAPMGKRKPLVVTTIGGAQYVQFLNTKSPKRMEVCDTLGIKASKMMQDQPCLHTANGPVILDPFEFFLTQSHFQHFSITDDQYNILESVMDVDEHPRGDFQEFMECIIVVMNDGELTPACCTFKGPKASAFHDGMTALSEKRDEPNDIGLFAGFTFTGTLREYTAKRSKRDMMLLDVEATPVDKKLAAKLEASFKDEQFMELLEECITSQKDRYATVLAKC